MTGEMWQPPEMDRDLKEKGFSRKKGNTDMPFYSKVCKYFTCMGDIMPQGAVTYHGILLAFWISGVWYAALMAKKHFDIFIASTVLASTMTANEQISTGPTFVKVVKIKNLWMIPIRHSHKYISCTVLLVFNRNVFILAVIIFFTLS